VPVYNYIYDGAHQCVLFFEVNNTTATLYTITYTYTWLARLRTPCSCRFTVVVFMNRTAGAGQMGRTWF
jgi:hypothetical protein